MSVSQASSNVGQLQQLSAGAIIPFGGDKYTTVSDELAAAFAPGDELSIVQTTGDLLHIPAVVRQLVTEQVDAAVRASEELRQVPGEQVAVFYRRFADALADNSIWEKVAAANAEDVARAQGLGRSTTRLEVSAQMREDMISGLKSWADYVSADRKHVVDEVKHADWRVTTVQAPLGVIAFVFEGRPNVFADAAGVLATGNTAVLRIGGDALGTAQAISDFALNPALEQAELPVGAVSLVPSRERAAGYALFSDSRLALAVVRGSGPAVTQLSSVARQNGIPVSAHGTGGAWIVADESADTQRFGKVIRHSLDRKVCNTVNVVVIPRSRAAELVPAFIAAADDAATARGNEAARIHVALGSQEWLSAAEFNRQIAVDRPEGTAQESRATELDIERLGEEWEWENTPEVSLIVVEDIAEAVQLFNTYSPQFVASLVAQDHSAHEQFRAQINAPFVGDGFTRWVDGQYALNQPELGLSNWQFGRLLARGGILTGADLITHRVFATHDSADQHR